MIPLHDLIVKLSEIGGAAIALYGVVYVNILLIKRIRKAYRKAKHIKRIIGG